MDPDIKTSLRKTDDFVLEPKLMSESEVDAGDCWCCMTLQVRATAELGQQSTCGRFEKVREASMCRQGGLYFLSGKNRELRLRSTSKPKRPCYRNQDISDASPFNPKEPLRQRHFEQPYFCYLSDQFKGSHHRQKQLSIFVLCPSSLVSHISIFNQQARSKPTPTCLLPPPKLASKPQTTLSVWYRN